MLTFVLIAVTVLVSWLAFERPALLDRLILWPPAIDRKKQYDRLLTHGFIHADWSHLLFNMITLYFFGREIERVMAELVGPLGFVLFYLSAIVIAILPTYLRHRHDPTYRSLGASGAVSAAGSGRRPAAVTRGRSRAPADFTRSASRAARCPCSGACRSAASFRRSGGGLPKCDSRTCSGSMAM